MNNFANQAHRDSPKTLFDKVWDAHAITALESGSTLLHVDRLLLHDLSGNSALTALEERGLSVRHPELSLMRYPAHPGGLAQPIRAVRNCGPA